MTQAEPPVLPQGLAKRLAYLTEEATEPSNRTEGIFTTQSARREVHSKSVPDSWTSGKAMMRAREQVFPLLASEVAESLDIPIVEPVTFHKNSEDVEVTRLRSELAAAERRQGKLQDRLQDMEGHQEDLLAELKAFQLELTQEQLYNQELKAEADGSHHTTATQAAQIRNAAKDLTAAGAKLFRLLQAQYVMTDTATPAREATTQNSQRPLYKVPPRSSFDEAARTLLAEMSASLQVLQEPGACLRGEGHPRTPLGPRPAMQKRDFRT